MAGRLGVLLPGPASEPAFGRELCQGWYAEFLVRGWCAKEEIWLGPMEREGRLKQQQDRNGRQANLRRYHIEISY